MPVPREPQAASVGSGKGHELNLWVVGDALGLQVLRFTDDFLKTKHGKAVHAEAVGDEQPWRVPRRSDAPRAGAM